ncbi:hypothetical protein F5H01DRAFT_345461 [Linnemannia elongata]|nr:hypothetical protein F5H01DRAFT_345461 [Linnemannia elongata]
MATIDSNGSTGQCEDLSWHRICTCRSDPDSQERRLSGRHGWRNNTIFFERSTRIRSTSSCIGASQTQAVHQAKCDLHTPPTSVFSIARTGTPSFQPIAANICTDILVILFVLTTAQFLLYTILVSAGAVRDVLFLLVQEGASFFEHVYLITLLLVTKTGHLWPSPVWLNPLTYMEPQQQQ